MKALDARRATRHELSHDIEITDSESGIQIRARTKDLSLYGCGVTTATPFPAGSKVMLKIYGEKQIVIAFGKVMYGRQDSMGIALTAIAPNDQKALEDLLVD